MEKFQNSYHSPNYFLMIVSAVTSSSSAVVCGSGRVLSSYSAQTISPSATRSLEPDDSSEANSTNPWNTPVATSISVKRTSILLHQNQTTHQ